MTIWAAAALLFLVMDPLGNVPVFLGVLKDIEDRRRPTIILREMLIALTILIFFMLVGRQILSFLHIDEPALSISGGIILFLIALKMIFPESHGMLKKPDQAEPFIVPLAVPLIAGPSAIATVLLLVAREPFRLPEWIVALAIAWLLTSVVLITSIYFSRHLDRRMLIALERLMGMILTTISVQMFLMGVQKFVQAMPHP